MIRKKDERTIALKNKNQGGNGITKVVRLAESPEELNGKARFLAHLSLEPGDSIGYHTHENETEVYYILRGSAEYSDNGTVTCISAGDVTFTASGEGHSIRNNGSETLEFLALIL